MDWFYQAALVKADTLQDDVQRQESTGRQF